MTNPSNTSSTPKPRKPRKKKWASEIARQQHSNARRALAREAASREANRLSRGLDDVNRAKRRIALSEQNRRSNMVANGLTPRLTAVMNSWGLTLPVSITPGRSVSGATDFDKIVITHDHRLTETTAEGFKLVTDEELRQIAAETRGVFYHEVGHNLFTVPLQEVIEVAVAEGYYPHGEQATLAQEADEWRRWAITSSFQRAWNILEDQRMEMLLVEESPAIASMLTVLVVRNMLSGAGAKSSWLLIAGRQYLPQSVRDASRTLWEDSRRYEPNLATAKEVKSVVDQYAVADTATEMIRCIELMRQIVGQTPVSGVDSHSGMTSSTVSKDPAGTQKSSERIKDTGERAQQIASEQKDESEQDGQAGAPSEKSEQEQNDSGQGDASDSETADRSSETAQGSGAGSGEEDPYEFDYKSRQKAKDALEDALEDMLGDLENDSSLKDDVTAMNEAYNTDDGSLPKYAGLSRNENEDHRSKALSMVGDIERAFDIATADCAPHWESQQRRGVLEPIRYRTRQPGDMEVFRSWSEDGEPGTDIAVSLFVDISGSMYHSESALGAMAWAVKTACGRVGIECEVVAFDHNAYGVWGVNDEPIDIPRMASNGGTDPRDAFSAVLWDERPQKHHVVMVMSDGEWNDMTVFTPFKHSNIHSMMFFYDGSGTTPMAPSPRWAQKTNMDEAYTIGDLSDIPVALESMLIGLV